MRTTATASLILIASCAHATSTTPFQAASAPNGVPQLRGCIENGTTCTDLTTELETRLHPRYAGVSRPTAAQIVSTLRRHDTPSFLASVIGHCGRGHGVSCRALWWAIERLYLDDDSSSTRANECALTRELAAATEEQR